MTYSVGTWSEDGSRPPERCLSATTIGTVPMLNDVVLMAHDLGMSEDDRESRLVRLYRAYVAELDAYAEKIDRPGWRRATISTLEAPVRPAIAG